MMLLLEDPLLQASEQSNYGLGVQSDYGLEVESPYDDALSHSDYDYDLGREQSKNGKKTRGHQWVHGS